MYDTFFICCVTMQIGGSVGRVLVGMHTRARVSNFSANSEFQCQTWREKHGGIITWGSHDKLTDSAIDGWKCPIKIALMTPRNSAIIIIIYVKMFVDLLVICMHIFISNRVYNDHISSICSILLRIY